MPSVHSITLRGRWKIGGEGVNKWGMGGIPCNIGHGWPGLEAVDQVSSDIDLISNIHNI